MPMVHRKHGKGIKMLKATEAWAITKRSDKYTEQLSMIEQEIQKEAERGGSSTWWYCENITDYERKNFGKKIRRVWLYY